MLRIMLSVGVLLVIAAALAAGTKAFFGDPNGSSGNTFGAEHIDLRIDNESYYNGVFNDATSWLLSDLGEECTALDDASPCLFFNFLDLKPGDYGEDTISIHIDSEEAWACMDITVRDFAENGCNEPETVDGDITCGDPGVGEGELQEYIEFIWWPDDGDNVLEDDEAEQVFIDSVAKDLSQTVVLADSSETGIFGPGTFNGYDTHYIGKGWCFGELTLEPLPQDELGNGNDNGPIERGAGFACDGSGLGNIAQTDSLMGDISFRAGDEDSSPDFSCTPEPIEGIGLPFEDNFGNGNTDGAFDEAPVWTEGGAGAEKRGPAGQEESSSPDGNRVAAMEGPDGSICIALDASGYSGVELEYYWRGDDDALAGDEGIVEYATAGSCASPSGVTEVTTHDMTDSTNPPWHLSTDDLSAVDDSPFLLIFRVATSGGDVDFRIDGVSVTGTPI